MPIRSTHTFARLAVSQATHDEIWCKLDAAGYKDQLIFSGVDGKLIDMHGIALVVEKPKPRRKRKRLNIQ